MIDGSVFLRRELMIRFVRAFNNGSLETELDRFPVEMRPRQDHPSRSSNSLRTSSTRVPEAV